MPSDSPHVTIVLATHNRKDVTMATLDRLRERGASAPEYQIILVDNASTDGTAAAAKMRGDVEVIALTENLGSCAKALGVRRARGELLLFLDDDSFPRLHSLERMLSVFERQPRLGAAGFMVYLPSGQQESSALPHVFVGCGVALRRAALEHVGGLDLSFFMQAEEYDLAMRLVQAGWRVQTFADLEVDHLKTPHARQSARTTYFDVRNNLRVIARYMPGAAARIYAEDWSQRYRWLAQASGQIEAWRSGERAALRGWFLERWRYRRWRLNDEAFELLFCWQRVERQFRRLRAGGIRRVTLVDWGKNAYAFVRGARAAGVEIVAIGDDRFAAVTGEYRGIAMLPLADALQRSADALVIANMSYAHAAMRAEQLRRSQPLPVYSWFAPPEPSTPGGVSVRTGRDQLQLT